jgi:hypothetical protein
VKALLALQTWQRRGNGKSRNAEAQKMIMGKKMAGATGLEPAASGVTGRRSNQLSYAPAGMSGLKAEVSSSQGAEYVTPVWF